MPPGILLNPQSPLSFQPFVSNPRPPGTPQYERLMLISSRIIEPMKIASAVLPNVAVVVYDWKNFTYQELIRYVKKAIGTNKVASLAVVAPGNKPGCVCKFDFNAQRVLPSSDSEPPLHSASLSAVLDGSTTTVEKLREKGELLQFWKVLSGCVSTANENQGRRVDLIGCRLVESPPEAAAVLKELWAQTAVPFAAADDALGGYLLATFLEDPNTKTLSLISSTIQAVDLYFNR